jgi:hypothetical protein
MYKSTGEKQEACIDFIQVSSGNEKLKFETHDI